MYVVATRDTGALRKLVVRTMATPRVTAIAVAIVGCAVGGLLTVLLLASYDSSWGWLSELTAVGWASTLVPSLIALAITTLSSVWAYRVFSPERRGAWLLPVALGAWWFTWWLVPSNFAVLGLDAAYTIDWDATAAPPDTLVWILGVLISVVTWLATLLLWYGRRHDRGVTSRRRNQD